MNPDIEEALTNRIYFQDISKSNLNQIWVEVSINPET